MMLRTSPSSFSSMVSSTSYGRKHWKRGGRVCELEQSKHLNPNSDEWNFTAKPNSTPTHSDSIEKIQPTSVPRKKMM